MGFFDRLFGRRAAAVEETRFSGEKMVVKAPIDGIVLPLEQLPDETYRITDKGREHEEITCDAIAYPVMQRALMAVQRYNTRIQRKGLIETKIEQEETGDYLAQLCLRDDAGVLMKLELAAPTLSQARTLVRAYEKQADAVYQQLLCQLLDEKESGHAEL